MRDHVRAHYVTKVACLGAEHPVTLGDLAFARGPATRRARAGLGLEDYINAFRVGHRVFWDALLDSAGDSAGGREAALTLATPLMRYCEVASTHAGHVFTETLHRTVADADRDRRELLEQLLAGELPAHGPLRRLAQATGVAPDAALLAVVAAPAGRRGRRRGGRRRAGASRARRARGRSSVARGGARSIAVVPGCGHARCASACSAPRAPAREGVPLALGVSPPANGVAELPRAFAEARAALECVDGDGGVAALPLMSPLRYLTRSAPDTARRLVDPRLRTFLARTARAAGCCATRSARSPRPTSSSAWPPRACRSTRTRAVPACGGSRSARAAIPRRVADLLELLTAIALDDG